MLKLEYSGRTRSVSWLLMACLLPSLRHHQSWYCICRKNKSVSILGRNWTIYTTSMLRNDEIYIYMHNISWKQISMKTVKVYQKYVWIIHISDGHMTLHYWSLGCPDAVCGTMKTNEGHGLTAVVSLSWNDSNKSYIEHMEILMPRVPFDDKDWLNQHWV